LKVTLRDILAEIKRRGLEISVEYPLPIKGKDVWEGRPELSPPGGDFIPLEKVIEAFRAAGVIPIRGQPFACVSEDTRVLTRNGFKPIAEVSTEDEILVYDFNTGETFYEKPLRKFEYDYEGPMILVSKQRGPSFLVTPNHRVPLVSRYGVKKTVLAGELDKHTQNYFVVTGVYRGEELDSFELPEYYGKRLRIPIRPWLRLLGIYLAEGCIFKDKALDIRQTTRKAEIAELLKDLPLNVIEHSRGFYIYSRQLVEYFKQLGKSHEKYIPREFKQLKPELLEELLQALLIGDGTLRDGRYVAFSTVSKQLAEDVAEIAFKCGYAVAIKVKQSKSGYGNIYRVRLKRIRDHPLLTKNDVLIVPYKGKVYCFQTSTGYFVIEHRGHLSITGNSYLAGRIVNEGGIPADHDID